MDSLIKEQNAIEEIEENEWTVPRLILGEKTKLAFRQFLQIKSFHRDYPIQLL